MQPDSVSRALATVFIGHLAPVSDSTFVVTMTQLDDYCAGLRQGLTGEEDDAYARGAVEGKGLRRHLDQMQSLGLRADREAVADALIGALGGEGTGFTPGEAQAYLARSLGLRTVAATLDSAAEARFIAEARLRPGVINTPSGVVVVTTASGIGDAPGPDDIVNASYVGSLSDGSVFDSTESPIDLPMGALVPGMTEGLLYTRAGGTYRIYIPASQAYGSTGIGGVIPGNATLVFDITVHAVKHP